MVKKYFVVLPLIASCSGVINSHNVIPDIKWKFQNSQKLDHKQQQLSEQLIKAITLKDTKSSFQLTSQITDVNTPDSNGNTPLIEAIKVLNEIQVINKIKVINKKATKETEDKETEYIENEFNVLVKRLLEKGANLYQTDGNGNTPLQAARGNIALTMRLKIAAWHQRQKIDSSGIYNPTSNVNDVNDANPKLLDIDKYKHLLKLSKRVDGESKDINHGIIYNNRKEITVFIQLENLLQNPELFPDFDSKIKFIDDFVTKNHENFNAQHVYSLIIKKWVTLKKEYNILLQKLLCSFFSNYKNRKEINHYFNIDPSNSNPYSEYITVLGLAVMQSNHYAAELLLQHGACIDRLSLKRTSNSLLLDPKLDTKLIDQVAPMDEHGTRTREKRLGSHHSILDKAVLTGDLPMVELLCSYGKKNGSIANVINLQNRRFTPLTKAVENKNKPMADYLLHQGANIDLTDHLGSTPLIMAIRKKDRDMAEWLLAKGANPNAPGRYGHTPLGVATLEAKDQNLIKLLLDKGAKKK